MKNKLLSYTFISLKFTDLIYKKNNCNIDTYEMNDYL